jgi:prepilin-type N-terminal cleavage/methylation domain-containing protein
VTIALANARGFSLLETLVATTVLTVAVAALAQLFILATRANRSAGATTHAAILAQQKMEQLRSLTWRFEDDRGPASDPGLSPSPANALDANAAGYCDAVDRFGRVLDGDGMGGAAYIRRWSIVPLPSNPANTLVLQVRVVRAAAVGSSILPAPGTRVADEARLVSVRTRKAR